MNEELTNLIPRERFYALRRDYFFRLGTVIAVFFIVLVCIAAALLLPTYVFLTISTSAKEAQLSNIKSTLSSNDEKELSERFRMLSNNAAALTSLAHASSVGAITRAMLAIPRPGVTISNFSYGPTVKNKLATFSISGSAATRDALRNYQLAIQSAPFAVSANLPVSSYAQDADIDFTIVVTLRP